MITLSRPSIRRRDMDAVLTCMVSDSLGPGSLSDQLTNAVGEYLGLAGGIALRERARAFSLALDRLALEPGSSIVLDPLVPHAYHAVIVDRGMQPVYVDVLDSSLCLDPDQVAEAVTSRTEGPNPVGAIVTHTTLGFVPEMETLSGLGVPVIEDISHGIGANTGEQRVGRFGRFVLVAMEPDGVITAGGGTLLLTASKSDRSALRKAADVLSSEAMLPDMNAALGLTQIKEIEKFVSRRAEIAAVYSRAIMRGRHRSPVQPGEAENVYLTFPVLVEGSVQDVTAYARKKGVETAPAFEESVLARYGRRERVAVGALGEAVGAAAGAIDGVAAESRTEEDVDTLRTILESDYPVARSLLLRCLRFPLYPSLTAKEVATIERVLTTLP